MNDRTSEEVDVEAVLDRFRRWLESARAGAAATGPDRPAAGRDGEARPEFGLVQLVEEFTALRHELKLQTKSGRGLIDQAESTVAALRQAIEQFRSVEPKEAQAAWAAGRPIAEALGDLDEALARGRREIERISRRLGEDSVVALADAVDERFRRQSWLRRLLTADFHRQVQNVVRNAAWLRRDLLDALLEGYHLIHARLARVMAAEQIARIPTEGRPVDPERMIVLEVVDDPDRPSGTVSKELRSGYTWRGRLLRYAEVQAVAAAGRGPAPTAVADGDVADDELEPDGPDATEDDVDEAADLEDVEPDGTGAGRPRAR
jgi:molecular chaperone GrpE